MSGGTCREQSSTDASDSSMCGLKEPVAPVERSHEERVFPLASIPDIVVTAVGNYGKRRRQEIDSAQRIRNNRLRGGKENTATRNPHPQ